MIGTKKRRDIQKELRKVFAELPTEGPTDWLEREIADAMNEPGAMSKPLNRSNDSWRKHRSVQHRSNEKPSARKSGVWRQAVERMGSVKHRLVN